MILKKIWQRYNDTVFLLLSDGRRHGDDDPEYPVSCPALWLEATRMATGSANHGKKIWYLLLSGVPDYFGRNKISSGGDLSHYSSASLY